MNLLFERSQKSVGAFSIIPLRIGSGSIFHLHASLELDEEEQALLTKYNMTKTALVVSDPIDDLRSSFRPALLLGIITFLLVWLVNSWTAAFGLAVTVTLVMTIVYFKTLREQITVHDLLETGRWFHCDSVVALVQKEAYLENICAYLRQVLESAKHWDDRETISIAPLSKAEAKRALL